VASLWFKKILTVFIQIFIVITISFFLVRIMPGDPALLVLGTDKASNPEAIKQIHKELGLDTPPLHQYATYINDILHLDFGTSFANNTEVINLLKETFPKTLELAIVAMIIGSALGIVFGVIAAVNRGGMIDKGVSAVAAIGISFPVFITGAFFIIIFSFRLDILPASGYAEFWDNPMDHIIRLILPAITLAFSLSAPVARMMRSSMLETLNKDFVQTLRAKGLNERLVIFKHILRNAIISVVTVIGLELGNLIGGSVILEYLYNWPGINSLLVQSIEGRDFPVIQGSIIVIASFYIIINLLVEFIYGLMDPRTR